MMIPHQGMVRNFAAPCVRDLSSYRGEPCLDQIWKQIHAEAEQRLHHPTFSRFGMARVLEEEVLDHDNLVSSLSHMVGIQYQTKNSDIDYKELLEHALSANDGALARDATVDLLRISDVDPGCAADGVLGVYLFYKGFQAITSARVAHHFWQEEGDSGKMLARLLQKKQSDVFDVEIHPGAQFGRGLTLGQGCGVTIGETVVVGDNVYIMHGVTLGATGTSPDFDRHPKIGSNVLLGAKCTVIGNITVGDGSVVASASLVNRLVPPGYTAIGIPARMFPPRAKDQ